ncbi:MAG TPA: hypothetical protein VJT33_12620 [bacterium]|nr:hypothetical protein [bacterium]
MSDGGELRWFDADAARIVRETYGAGATAAVSAVFGGLHESAVRKDRPVPQSDLHDPFPDAEAVLTNSAGAKITGDR